MPFFFSLFLCIARTVFRLPSCRLFVVCVWARFLCVFAFARCSLDICKCLTRGKLKNIRRRNKTGEGVVGKAKVIWCKPQFFKKKNFKKRKLCSFAFCAHIFIQMILCTTCGLKCEIWGIK